MRKCRPKAWNRKVVKWEPCPEGALVTLECRHKIYLMPCAPRESLPCDACAEAALPPQAEKDEKGDL
jgi:hypothetical protein